MCAGSSERELSATTLTWLAILRWSTQSRSDSTPGCLSFSGGGFVKRAIIKTVYSGRNGFINPRLLCPYIRLTEVDEKDEEEEERKPVEGEHRGPRVFVAKKSRRCRLWYSEWHEKQERREEKAFTPTRNFFSGAALTSESKILRESTSRGGWGGFGSCC